MAPSYRPAGGLEGPRGDDEGEECRADLNVLVRPVELVCDRHWMLYSVDEMRGGSDETWIKRGQIRICPRAK